MSACRRVATTLVWFLVATSVSADPRGRGNRSALELFERSTVSYRAGRFSEAAELLRRAYRIDADPVILYNLGKALEADGDLESALDAYERYLAVASPPDRPVVERRIATLREQLAARSKLREQEAAALRERALREDVTRREEEHARADRELAIRAEADAMRARAHRSATRGAVAWSVAAIGTATIGAAIGVGVAASQARDHADAAPSATDAARDFAGAERLALGCNVALAVGGGLALVGIVWGSIETAKQRRLHR